MREAEPIVVSFDLSIHHASRILPVSLAVAEVLMHMGRNCSTHDGAAYLGTQTSTTCIYLRPYIVQVVL